MVVSASFTTHMAGLALGLGASAACAKAGAATVASAAARMNFFMENPSDSNNLSKTIIKHAAQSGKQEKHVDHPVHRLDDETAFPQNIPQRVDQHEHGCGQRRGLGLARAL